MMNFVASFFDVSYEEAVKIRAEHIRDFSTTLEWLRSEGLTDVESYFSAVHPPYEADELEENPSLRPFLESIRIPKIILTNAPSEHAERVLEKLRVRDLFTAVCDIRTSGLLGKPYPQAFRSALEKCGGTTENTLFIDDMKKIHRRFCRARRNSCSYRRQDRTRPEPEVKRRYRSKTFAAGKNNPHSVRL